jgi:hypothetical protein
MALKGADNIEISETRKRQYWDLERDETIEMSLKYLPELKVNQDKLPMMMCFAWCNSDMLDSAPLREAPVKASPVADIIARLVRP